MARERFDEIVRSMQEAAADRRGLVRFGLGAALAVVAGDALAFGEDAEASRKRRRKKKRKPAAPCDCPEGSACAGDFCVFRDDLNRFQVVRPGAVAASGAERIVANTGGDSVLATLSGSFQEFGDTGGGELQFQRPEGVAVDARDGGIAVADTGNHRIQLLSAGGGFERAIGSLGSGRGQFDTPRAVAVGDVGEIIVADTGNDRVQVFSQGGVFLREIGGGGSPVRLAAPAGVAEDGQDRIFVADTGAHEIKVFSGGGDFVTSFGRQGNGQGEFEGPTGLAISGDVLAVADTGNDRVQFFRLDGQFIAAAGKRGSALGEFSGPRGVAFDRDSNVLVADTGNNRVVRLVPRDSVAPNFVARPASGERRRRRDGAAGPSAGR